MSADRDSTPGVDPAGEVSFRPLEDIDFQRLEQWRGQPFVSRWFGGSEPKQEEVEEVYGPRVDGDDPTLCFIILLDERPIGLIQTYCLADYPAYQDVIAVEEEAACLELFIGERDCLQQGLGPEIISRFLIEVVFDRFAVDTCLAGPHPDNRVAIGAFRKAGFHPMKTVRDADTGQAECVMWIGRSQVSSSHEL